MEEDIWVLRASPEHWGWAAQGTLWISSSYSPLVFAMSFFSKTGLIDCTALQIFNLKKKESCHLKMP